MQTSIQNPIIIWFTRFFPTIFGRVHPGRLTAGTPTNHPWKERNMILQTSMIMFHVNLQGCTLETWRHFSCFAKQPCPKKRPFHIRGLKIHGSFFQNLPPFPPKCHRKSLNIRINPPIPHGFKLRATKSHDGQLLSCGLEDPRMDVPWAGHQPCCFETPERGKASWRWHPKMDFF